jgi:hypothetical protein
LLFAAGLNGRVAAATERHLQPLEFAQFQLTDDDASRAWSGGDHAQRDESHRWARRPPDRRASTRANGCTSRRSARKSRQKKPLIFTETDPESRFLFNKIQKTLEIFTFEMKINEQIN